MLTDNRRPTVDHNGYTEGRPMLCVKRANGHPRYVVVQPTCPAMTRNAAHDDAAAVADADLALDLEVGWTTA